MIEFISIEDIPKANRRGPRPGGPTELVRELLANPGKAARIPLGGRTRESVVSSLSMPSKKLGCRISTTLAESRDAIYAWIAQKVEK